MLIAPPRGPGHGVSRARRTGPRRSNALPPAAARGQGRGRRCLGLVDPRSVLLVTLDSCRYDTFIAADAPNLKNVGEQVHAAQAPSHFTYGSHMAMFVGFTPGISGARTAYLNPKYSTFFRIAK